MSYEKVTKSYEKLQKVTFELRKSYEKLQKVTKSYKRLTRAVLEVSFSEILEKWPPVRASIKVGRKKVNRAEGPFKELYFAKSCEISPPQWVLYK